MNKITIIAAFLAFTGCAAPQLMTEQRDSITTVVRKEVIYRDSIIYVPVPEGTDKSGLPDTDTSYLETRVAESTAYVTDGVLYHTLRNRSEAVIPITIKIPERLRVEEKGMTRYLKTVERVEVEKELSRWQSFIQGLGHAVLIAGALWLAWKLAKIVRSFS